MNVRMANEKKKKNTIMMTYMLLCKNNSYPSMNDMTKYLQLYFHPEYHAKRRLTKILPQLLTENVI